MANPKTFGRLLRNPSRQSTVGLKALYNDNGVLDIDVIGMNKTQLQNVLKILNAEANNRLIVAKNNINKDIAKGKTINQILGNTVGNIYEFNPATGGRLAKLKSGEFGIRQFITPKTLNKTELIREIRSREAFLNKKTSTMVGFKNYKRQQKLDFQEFIGGELRNLLGRNPSKKEKQKVYKAIEKLKNKTDKTQVLVFRDKTKGNVIGTDTIIQQAFQIMRQNKVATADEVVDIINANYNRAYERYQIEKEKAINRVKQGIRNKSTEELAKEVKNAEELAKQIAQAEFGEFSEYITGVRNV